MLVDRCTDQSAARSSELEADRLSRFVLTMEDGPGNPVLQPSADS